MKDMKNTNRKDTLFILDICRFNKNTRYLKEYVRIARLAKQFKHYKSGTGR